MKDAGEVVAWQPRDRRHRPSASRFCTPSRTCQRHFTTEGAE